LLFAVCQMPCPPAKGGIDIGRKLGIVGVQTLFGER